MQDIEHQDETKTETETETENKNKNVAELDRLIREINAFADAYTSQPTGMEVEGTVEFLRVLEKHIQSEKAMLDAPQVDPNYRHDGRIYMPNATFQAQSTIDAMANLTKALLEYLGTQPSKLLKDSDQDFVLNMLQNKISVMLVQVFISLNKLAVSFDLTSQVENHLKCVPELYESILKAEIPYGK